jgi:F-type H+-transporting ATPase subunit b
MAAETNAHDGPPAAGTAEVAHEGGGGGGLPQFRFEHWGGQIVWLLLVFAILYVLLAKVFVPKLRQVQEDRAQTIADAVEQARRVQAEADSQAAAAKAEIADARAQTRRVAAEAKAKSQAEMAARQAEEDQRLAAELEKAEQRIRALRDQAMGNVGAIAADAAEAIVAKLTGKAASRAEMDTALGVRTPEGVA